MPQNFKRYMRIWAGLLLGGAAVVAAVNVLVDPYDVFAGWGLDALTPYRNYGSRIAKAEGVYRGGVEVLILGSSRAETGLDPHSPLWPTTQVYNAALTGAELEELGHVFDFAAAHNGLRCVVLGVDFIMFTQAKQPPSTFEQSRFNPQMRQSEYLLANLLGWGTLKASRDVLKDYWRSEPPEYTPLGHHREAYPNAHRRLFESILRRQFFQEPTTYLGYRYAPQRLEVLRHIAGVCQERGIRLIVLIPPVHALQLEAIRLMGLWPLFEQWKRDLTAAVDPQVALWDFTGYRGPMAEAVPPADSDQPMRWYYESSHFKADLGERVIARVLGRGSTEDEPFGVRLTSQNIEAHLAQLRADRQRYADAQPQEIAWIEALHRRSMQGLGRD